MSWSSDSSFLLVHRDDDLFLVDTRERLRAQRLDVRTSGYRVPAWHPGEHRVNIVSTRRPSRFTLESASITTGGIGESKKVMEVAQDPAFLWSPDGRSLAVAGANRALPYRELALLVYESVVVLSEDEERPPIEIEDNLIAYFGSPDGRRLAYVTLSETRRLLRWTVLNVEDGSRLPLVEFVPSLDQLTMFQFFDQYAYSHTLWSPDSRSLVFAGTVQKNQAVSASFWGSLQGEPSHINVVDVDLGASSRVIADGILGCWSPR